MNIKTQKEPCDTVVPGYWGEHCCNCGHTVESHLPKSVLKVTPAADFAGSPYPRECKHCYEFSHDVSERELPFFRGAFITSCLHCLEHTQVSQDVKMRTIVVSVKASRFSEPSPWD